MSTVAVTAQFIKCHAVTAAWEGGWSDHPADPGGKTMYGVTEAVWTAFRKKWGLAAKPIRSITRPDAEMVFFSEYWQAAGCPGLAAGVDLATYDASVNSGVSRGRKWLLSAIGGPDVETVKKICAKRLGFVQALRSWRTFGRGWSNRIADVQAKGVAMALKATGDSRVIVDQVRDEGDKKARFAAKQTTGAVGTGAVGTSSVAAEQSTQAADWLLTGLGVLMLAAVVFLLWRAFLNGQQAKAFAAEAESM